MPVTTAPVASACSLPPCPSLLARTGLPPAPWTGCEGAAAVRAGLFRATPHCPCRRTQHSQPEHLARVDLAPGQMPSRARRSPAADSSGEASADHLSYRPRRQRQPRAGGGPTLGCTAQQGLIKAKTTHQDGVTLELFVLPRVSPCRRMTLAYYWEGARPSEV